MTSSDKFRHFQTGLIFADLPIGAKFQEVNPVTGQVYGAVLTKAGHFAVKHPAGFVMKFPRSAPVKEVES